MQVQQRSPRAARLVFVVVLTLAALVVAACGSDNESGGGSGGEKKVTLSMLVGQQETARLEAEAKKEIERFNEEHPNIQVKRESMDNDQLRTVVKTRLGSDQAPDVFGYDTGPGFGGVLAKSNLVAPIDDAYAKYKWNIYPWAKARATYGGKTYAVPTQVEEVGIYYNKDIFSKLGAQPPKTVDELMAIADKAKAQKLIPLAYGDRDQWPASHQFSMTVSNLLGREGLDEILYGDGRWNDPKVVRGIELFFREFQDKGYFPKGANGIEYEDANALFFAGKAAMLPTGTWLVSQITQQAPFEVGFFPFPSIDGSKVAPPAGVGGGWFVAERSKKKAAVYEFLDWQLSKDTASNQVEVFNAIPAFPLDTSGLKVSPLFKQVLDDMAKSQEDESAFGYNIDVLTPANFNEVMSSGFQDVLNGSRTAKQQADRLQAAWAKAEKAGDTLEKP